MRKTILIFLVFVFVLSLPVVSQAQLPAGIEREDTLIAATVTGRVGSPDNFNEWVGWKWRDRGIQQLMNESLWTADAAAGKIIPGLAAGDPMYNEDFTQLTIAIREGCYWSDGVPVTADDVIYTIDIHKGIPGLNFHDPIAEDVKEVQKIDDYTVTLKLQEPNPRFHLYFLDDWGSLWIMPKHIFENVDDVLTFTFDPPVSSGPYVLHDYDPAGYWTIWTKRDDWDRTPTGILYGEPKPEYVIFQHFDTEEAKIIAILRNELDSAIFSPLGFDAVLTRSDTTRPWHREWPWVSTATDPCPTGIIFNTMQSPYDLKDVRWALILAIDVVEFMTIAVDLMAIPIPLHVPPTPLYKTMFMEPMEEWLKNFKIDVGERENFKPFDPEAPLRLAEEAEKMGYPIPEEPEALRELFGMGWWKYAPEIAEKLLNKHGFWKDEAGMWHLPDGSPWKMEILASPVLEGYGTRNVLAASEQWKKFGIDVTVLYSEEIVTLQRHGQFQVSAGVAAHEQEGVTGDLYDCFGSWHSSYIRPIDEWIPAYNFSRWSDPRMDDLVDRLRLVDPTDYKVLQTLGIEGLEILVEEMPTVPTFGNVVYQVWDEAFWTNWPGAENPYCQISADWPNFKYTLPFLESVDHSAR